MADIRKRTNENGSVSYQVRFTDPTSKSGYGYKSFKLAKQANKFKAKKDLEENQDGRSVKVIPVTRAVELWLEICVTEGTDGNDPITDYSLENYQYYAEFMKAYNWPTTLNLLSPPEIVDFRTWLLANCPSRYVARKTLAYFTGALNEMMLRGFLTGNVAIGVTIKETSRYDTQLQIPTEAEVIALLEASDRLANSKDARTSRAWNRYRPILYLAVDCGPRPQEYLALTHSSLGNKRIVIDRAIEGSGRQISVTKTPAGIREIDASDDVMDMVRHYAENHAEPNRYDLIFPGESGRWQCRRNWQRRGFNQACFEAGLTEQVEDRKTGKLVEKPKYIPYDLRHFFASMIIEHIANLKKIQNRMGHRKFQTTMDTYGHLIEKRQDADYDYSNKEGGVVGWLM